MMHSIIYYIITSVCVKRLGESFERHDTVARLHRITTKKLEQHNIIL